MLSKDFNEFIELLNGHNVRYLKEIKFEDCYKARLEVDIQGLKINFIDLENQKHNKRATGRPQDLADAENLE